MKVIDKLTSTGPGKAYQDIPSDLLEFTAGCRVQPAPFIGLPLKFYFMKKYDDGIVARGENGIKYGFDLDQVIVWIDKREIKSLEPKVENTCGFLKKDGTKCLIKTKGERCRFHKEK
jgi:hypothetical protein